MGTQHANRSSKEEMITEMVQMAHENGRSLIERKT
jgi:hypothetical protein